MKNIVLILFIMCFCFLPGEETFSGQELFFQMKTSVGKVDSIRNIKTKGEVAQQVAESILQLPVEVIVQFPSKMYFHLEDKEYIVNGNEGWLKYEKGYYEALSEDLIQNLKGNLERNLLYILKYSDNFQKNLLEFKQTDGEKYALIQLISNKAEYIMWIDMFNNLPYKLVYKTIDERIIEKVYLQYEMIDKIMIPVHTKTVDEQGSIISENFIKEVELNILIDKDLFQ